jgi:hypothetical protein
MTAARQPDETQGGQTKLKGDQRRSNQAQGHGQQLAMSASSGGDGS